MATEQLTYIEIAERLKVSREAARAIVKRHRLPRSRSNDGKVLVAIDLEEIQHKPLSARSPRGHHPVTDAVAELEAKIKILETELANEKKRSTGHREDFERERGRVDQLLSELLTATSDLMSAREVTGRLEGELTALRSLQQRPSVPTVQVVARRSWWQWRRAG
jgi:chromosome segregation ATPase